MTATSRISEKWVGRHISIVKDQISNKHRLMAVSRVEFLRGTFYRWTQLFPEVCRDLSRAPAVLAVGDLHIASFGTWRDGFGRLIWGIDDFDEAYPLPYTNDLLRLAAKFHPRCDGRRRIRVGVRNVVEVIVDGYLSGLKRGGEPFVLEEEHHWLQENRARLFGCRRRSFWKRRWRDCPLPVIRLPDRGARAIRAAFADAKAAISRGSPDSGRGQPRALPAVWP